MFGGTTPQKTGRGGFGLKKDFPFISTSFRRRRFELLYNTTGYSGTPSAEQGRQVGIIVSPGMDHE